MVRDRSPFLLFCIWQSNFLSTIYCKGCFFPRYVFQLWQRSVGVDMCIYFWVLYSVLFTYVSIFIFLNFLLHFRFWGTCAEYARQLHRYTHGSVFCFLSPLHPHLAFLPMLSLSDLLTTPAVPPLAPPPCNRLCVHVLS